MEGDSRGLCDNFAVAQKITADIIITKCVLMKIQQQPFAIAQYMMDFQSYSFCIHSKISEILDELLPLLVQK